MLRKEFSTRFLGDGLGVNQATVEAMVDAAWQRVVASFEERTHYIACSIIEETDPEEFVVGPVQFIRAELFLQRHGQEIEGRKKVISEELTQRWKRGRNESSASEPGEVAAATTGDVRFAVRIE